MGTLDQNEKPEIYEIFHKNNTMGLMIKWS